MLISRSCCVSTLGSVPAACSLNTEIPVAKRDSSYVKASLTDVQARHTIRQKAGDSATFCIEQYQYRQGTALSEVWFFKQSNFFHRKLLSSR